MNNKYIPFILIGVIFFCVAASTVIDNLISKNISVGTQLTGAGTAIITNFSKGYIGYLTASNVYAFTDTIIPVDGTATVNFATASGMNTILLSTNLTVVTSGWFPGSSVTLLFTNNGVTNRTVNLATGRYLGSSYTNVVVISNKIAQATLTSWGSVDGQVTSSLVVEP